MPVCNIRGCRVAKRDEVHISTDKARAGATPHMTRVILPVSLVLIVVAFAVVTFIWR